MTKKGRVQVESSDSNEDKDGKSSYVKPPVCPHLLKSTHLSGVKKVVIGNVAYDECGECKKGVNEEKQEGSAIYLCLKCGALACAKHAELHSKNKQTDVHDVAVNTSTWIITCYKCDREVLPDEAKKLSDCVEFVKKRYKGGSTNGSKDASPDCSLSSSAKPIPLANDVDRLPSVRGLSNLGNTCFFNAVLQCLSQTPFLLSILEEMKEPGETFKLPGGEVVMGDEKIVLDPLEGELKEWGPLSKTLADTLSQLQSGKNEVFYPRTLINLLHNKCPQFAGYDQHDSHELLRQLLETVRTEDLQRYQQSILEKLGLDSRGERERITEDQRLKVKAYGRQANELLLHPEHVFRGFLVSILECQECYHVSEHVESFLDLSLPIANDKPVHHVRHRSTSEDVEKPSKHQIKKERKARGKKSKRRARNNSTNENGGEDETTGLDGEKEGSEDESDADIEDNIEPEAQQTQDVVESGYSSEKAVNGDSGCGSPASESNLVVNRDSALASPTAVTTLDVAILPSEPCPSPVVSSDNSPTRQEDTNNNKMDLLNIELNKLDLDKSPAQEVPSWNGSSLYSLNDNINDCTVQSCLNQFTTKELLTGNNKVGCEACTERVNKGEEGKMVLTNASKQFLICSPPAILILHLKRFQVCRFSFKKKSKEVKFPTVLNLAPYCSLKKKDGGLSRREPLYALYGVVEHSGTLMGGHYVAYVKVRKALAQDDPRWAFLPRKTEMEPPKFEEEPQGAAGGFPEVPPGKWYYVSDSHARPMSEDDVLRSQAYLLFYERIW